MKLFTISLLLLLPAFVFAQSNYHEGYVLKNNGDTLKGYINYREWVQSPKSIDFKINKSDRDEMKFTPETVKGFQINGMENYISYSGMVSMDKNDFPNLPSGLDTSKQQEDVFLRQVATGRYITLYYSCDEIKTRYFIAETKARPVELIYHAYYNDSDTKRIVTSAIYKGQLLLYINKFAKGDNKLINEANTMTYDQEYLGPWVNDINGDHKRKIRVASSRFYAGIGINATTTEVNGVEGNYTRQTYTTVAPKIDLGIDLFNNPNVQSLIFRMELSLSYAAPRYYYPVTAGSVNTNEVYEFNQFNATLSPQILVNIYNKDNFKFYLDGGLAFNLSVYTNNQFTFKSPAVDPNAVNTYTLEEPYHLQPSWLSFPVQAGIVLHKKTEIYFGYTRAAVYTQYTGFYASNQSVSLGVKFLLNR